MNDIPSASLSEINPSMDMPDPAPLPKPSSVDDIEANASNLYPSPRLPGDTPEPTPEATPEAAPAPTRADVYAHKGGPVMSGKASAMPAGGGGSTGKKAPPTMSAKKAPPTMSKK